MQQGFFKEYYDEAKEKGEIGYYDTFSHVGIVSVPGRTEQFPLWLSRNVRGRIFDFGKKVRNRTVLQR